MKIQELFEGPYHIAQDAKPVVKMDNYPSLENLHRLNDFLGTLQKDGTEFNFWLNKDKYYAEVTTSALDDISQKRQLTVTKVGFNNRANLPVQNELQVETVFTHPKYQSQNLAMALYVVLARYNFTIISDFTQYNGGKALWKKMAKESSARQFVVRIWDDELEDWVKDELGGIIKYNAENLDDEQIWDDISRNNEATTLLVLTSK
jgi:hypothetical protein